MAKSNFKKLTSIKDTEGGNFGNYDESKGGGSPKGGVWGGKSGRVGWDERQKAGELKQGDHRQDQPRTNDGKFTYNSVNGKETKYESRGETVNPLLTGGENGIKIDEAKQQFASKQGSLYDKYKDKWYQRGSELISKNGRKYNVKLSQNDIWEIARISFNIKEGAFTMENQNFLQTKAGRRSQNEKEAIQNAKANKQETFVKSSAPTGGIQQKAGSQPGQQLSTGIQFQLNPGIIAKFRKMQQLNQAVQQGWAGTSQPLPSSASNGLPGQLKGNAGPSAMVSPQLMNSLGGLVNQYLAVSVPNKGGNNNGGVAPAARPNVNLGGLANILKKKK